MSVQAFKGAGDQHWSRVALDDDGARAKGSSRECGVRRAAVPVLAEVYSSGGASRRRYTIKRGRDLRCIERRQVGQIKQPIEQT